MTSRLPTMKKRRRLPRIGGRRIPANGRIKRNLQKAFRRQRRALLMIIDRQTKSLTKGLPEAFTGIEAWLTANASDELQRMLWDNKPVVELIAQQEARSVLGRVGASDVVFDVKDPHVQAAVDRLILRFCEATNAATNREIGSAIAELRQSLGAGLDEGEGIRELTRRVEGIFDKASQYRARRIAATETSRAVHFGQQLGAEQSGVVTGKQWIASTDGCPLCLSLHGTIVPLSGQFPHDPEPGPYSGRPFPPAHPNCRCDMIEVVGE